jgi:MoaA/NifB/PqqE/SkfB family radical SAM enzyme
MNFYDNVRQIELELTTRCNAACPQCVRNFYGGRTWHTLPLTDLDFDVIVDRLEPMLSPGVLVRLCGTYGDPLMYRRVLDLVQWLVKHDITIAINTNASLRTPDWWQELARVLGDYGKVYFGIDGLEDTHHLHRRNTNFYRIMRNLQAFNDAGGHSVWSFLVFRHNQHQIEAARQMSQKMGCEAFAVKSTSRFVDKRHVLQDRTPVMDLNDRVQYWLEPTDLPEYINTGLDHVRQFDSEQDFKRFLNHSEITCMAQHTGLIVISAEGYVLPCGWLHDRFYGAEVETHPDRERLMTLINSNGGLKSISIYHNDILSIINGSVFQAIAASWNDHRRLERCANQCHNKNNLLVSANRQLASIWQGRTIFDIKQCS